MESVKYLHIKNFLKNDVPGASYQERANFVILNKIEFGNGRLPNQYRFFYVLRKSVSKEELSPVYVDIKLDPNSKSRTSIQLMEQIDIPLGHELLVYFEPLAGSVPATSINARITYQIFM